MRKLIVISLLLLAACTATATPAPAVEPTVTLVQTNTPPPAATAVGETRIPTPTLEIPISPTAEAITERVSSVDEMPQVYIPAGTSVIRTRDFPDGAQREERIIRARASSAALR